MLAICPVNAGLIIKPVVIIHWLDICSNRVDFMSKQKGANKDKTHNSMQSGGLPDSSTEVSIIRGSEIKREIKEERGGIVRRLEEKIY